MRVKESELGKYAERNGRTFRLVCKDGIYVIERNFKYREDLKRFINKASLTNILIYVIDEKEACI